MSRVEESSEMLAPVFLIQGTLWMGGDVVEMPRETSAKVASTGMYSVLVPYIL